MSFNTPFDYATILIGNEIIYRGLRQQKAFKRAGDYHMTWDTHDAKIQAQVMKDADTLKLSDFDVPKNLRGCVLDPPCPWPKNDVHTLSNDDLMPIVLANDGRTTYSFTVAKQTGTKDTVYEVGDILAEYRLDPSALDPSIQSNFLFYTKSPIVGYDKEAIIVIEKFNNNILQHTFTYLFKMTL